MALSTYECLAEELLASGSPTLPPQVWLLGQEYDLSKAPDEQHSLLARIARCLWFTYRRGFEPIGDTSLQFDSGWGCMLRCGQMLLGEALLRCRQGADAELDREAAPSDDLVVEVLRLFEDCPSAPYSIQNIALRGALVDKSVGDWFGPNAMAQVLKSLTTEQGKECDVAVHVAMDSCLCLADIDALHGADAGWKPLLLLIPLRLGLSGLQATYVEPLKHVFGFPQTVGAIGGKPNSAFYFVGVQGDDTIFLDPHTTQTTVSMKEDFSTQTFSCSEPQWMQIAKMDPSLCLGFFCRTRSNFDDLLGRLDKMGTTLVSVVDKHPSLDLLSTDDFVLDDEDDFEVI